MLLIVALMIVFARTAQALGLVRCRCLTSALHSPHAGEVPQRRRLTGWAGPSSFDHDLEGDGVR